MTGFGQHLTLDGYGCNREHLESIELIYSFLDEYPQQIQMTKIMPPYVFKYSGLKPEDWGISGFVLIAESHISIHTFPEKDYLSLDIFSCKPYDVSLAITHIKDRFEIKKFEQHILNRGLEFPKHIPLSKGIVNQDRLRLVGAGKKG